MPTYRIQILKVRGDETYDWDFVDKVLLIWGTAWIMKAAKEVALAYANK